MKTPSTRVLALVAAVPSAALGRLAPEYLYLNSTLTTFLVLFVSLILSRWTLTTIIYPKLLSPLRNLPQPSGGSFLFGQWFRILKDPSGEPQKQWAKTIPNNGLIYYRSIFNSERVFPTSIKAVTELLTTKAYDFQKPPMVIAGLERLLGGTGILLAEGDEHKRQRKLLNPAFTFRHIKDLYPIFWSKARELVLAVEKTVSEPSSDSEKPANVIEFSDWSNRATLDIIGLAGLDQDFNAIADPTNDLYQVYKHIFSPSRTARILGIMNLFLPRWLVRNLPVKRNGELEEASRKIQQHCHSIIRQKREKLEKGDAVGVDILSVALKSGGFTDQELVHQVMTFLAAGHETTATSMTWALFALGKHPEVQAKLREEIRASGLASVHDVDAAVAANDIEKIAYLSAVCNEVVRMYPPVPFTMRSAARDTTLANQFIPKDTTVVVSTLQWNHSVELWGPDADEFRPERWIEAEQAHKPAAKSNYAYMTFIHGPRSCIGQGFAKAEFMALLAAWVTAFDTELVPKDRPLDFEGGITTKPKGGLKVKLTPVAA